MSTRIENLREHEGLRPSTCRVLVPLATPCLYGLERAVIDAFDCLRPDISPHFVQSAAVYQRRPPIIDEIERRCLPFSLLPDGNGWPRIGRTRSPGRVARMIAALVKANLYYARVIGEHDVLYVTGVYAALFTVAAAARCRVTGRRVVHHFHELPASRRLPALWKWLVTDYVHNTPAGLETARKRDPGIRRARHTVLPGIVTAVNGRPRPDAHAPGGATLNVVYAGQVARHKGIDLLLQAFERIAPRYPSAVLQIVGGCDETFLPTFERMRADSPAADRVVYFAYRTDVASFLGGAYVLVQPTPPSRCAESFGRTVVEAMSAGVPSVCFASGALSEIVVNGETGIVCDESADALAAGLARFLADPAFRDSCGANALTRYQARFSPEVVRPLWVQFFRSLPAVADTSRAVDR